MRIGIDPRAGSPHTLLAAKSSAPSNAPGAVAPDDVHSAGLTAQIAAVRAGPSRAAQQQRAVAAHRPAEERRPARCPGPASRASGSVRRAPSRLSPRRTRACANSRHRRRPRPRRTAARLRRQPGPDPARLRPPSPAPRPLPLPCRAITGRSVPVWPGGRAIAQLVSTPPRAADTNEPVTYVGAAVGAGSSGAGGASGASRGSRARHRHRRVRSRGTRFAQCAKSEGACSPRGRAHTETHHRSTAQLWHAGHHAIAGWLTVGRRLGNASKSVGVATFLSKGLALAERAISTSACWQHASRDGSGDTQGRT